MKPNQHFNAVGISASSDRPRRDKMDTTQDHPPPPDSGGGVGRDIPTTHPPHRNSNSHRFGRPDADWLRKHALSGAMKSTAGDSRSQLASFGHGPDSEARSGLFPRNSTVLDQGAVHPRSRSNISSGGFGSSDPSPAAIGDPSQWLLPHPFRHVIDQPFVGQTSYAETENLEEESPPRSLGDLRSGSHRAGDRRPSTPVLTTVRERSSSPLQSPYFPGARHQFESQRESDLVRPEIMDYETSERQDPSSANQDARHTHRIVSMATENASSTAPSSDPFVSSETYRLSSRYQHHHQPQIRSLKESRPRHMDYPALSSSISDDSASISSSYTLSESLGAQSESLQTRQIHASKHPYIYGPSVISGGVTQTLTPNTSPYRREPAPVIARGSSGDMLRAIHHGGTATNRLGGQWRPNSLPQTPVKGALGVAPTHNHKQQDSSILSPLEHSMNRSRPPHVSTPDLAYRGPMSNELDNDGVERLRLLNLELGSDSESEGDDMDTHPIAPPNRQMNVNSVPNQGISELDEDMDRVICAVSESRSSDMIGIAIINVTGGQVDLVRIINDDRYERLVETLWRVPTRPQTFLVLKNVVDPHSKSALTGCLHQEFPGAAVVALDREHWNESEGLRLIDRFAWRKDIKALRKDLEHNFYVSCAFSAVMAYVEEETEVIFRDNALRIKYRQPAGTMGLDRSTISSLELFQNIRNAKNASSTLFGLLNNTHTPQGRRMVRSALLQPSTNREEITSRHESVEELSSNEDLFTEVRASLKKLLHIDVERSIPWVSMHAIEGRLPLEEGIALVQGHHQIPMPSHEDLQGAERDLNRILMLKAYLAGVQAIRETLDAADCTSQLCKSVMESCGQDSTGTIIGLIDASIEQDAIYSKAPIDMRNNRLWAVKAEPNSMLERARQLYRDLTEEMHQYVEELNKTFQEHLGIAPELRLAADNHYYLRFQWTDVERELTRQLSTAENGRQSAHQYWRKRLLGGVETTNGTRRKRHYDCQTIELIQKSSQIQRQADVVTAQSDKLVVELKQSVMSHAETLLSINEATAVLDMLCSFAHLATTQNYVRPIMSDTLVLKGARHPVMELRKQNFVSNDVYSGDRAARFQVVTGGNMSGKSTFIKAIALIQIMGQVGSFVPATYAALPVCDRLFSRLSTEDKPESNLGTFAVEMAEMNMILRQVTKDSLVIIDELGRGTSTKEGLAIALAMSEKLVETGCRVFFATHFTELAKVLNATKGHNVLNVNMSSESVTNGDTRKIILPHTLSSGPVKNEDYGLDLARRFLPQRVVDNAEQVCTFLRDRNTNKTTGPATRAVQQNKLILALPDLLKQALDSTMDDSALASYLKKLQTEFTIRMNIAADDGVVNEKTNNKDPAQGVTQPVIQKPTDEDLKAWKRKCDIAESRVMHANMVQSQDKKRPGGDNDGHPQKRSKTDDDTGTTMSSQATPINRASMIERLRRLQCTPTTRAQTPASLDMDIEDADGDSVMVTPAQENPFTRSLTAKEQRETVSISSDSSESDEEMDADDDYHSEVRSVAAHELDAGQGQPLEHFQPLKEWYARGGAAGSAIQPPEED